MRRFLVFLMFVAGMPVATTATAIEVFIVDLPCVLWGVLYGTEIPEPGAAMNWWFKVCQKAAGVSCE